MGAVEVLQLESYIAEDERATRAFILQLTLAMMAATLIVALNCYAFEYFGPDHEVGAQRPRGRGARLARAGPRGR